MKFLTAHVYSVLLFCAAGCACSGDLAFEQHAAPSESTVIGQLLLPAGSGSRGVEVLLQVAEDGSEPHTVWVRFDERGRFRLTVQGEVTSFAVNAGIGRQIYQIEAEDLPRTGEVDVGVIDLRDQLVRHRLQLRAAAGAQLGKVRIGMWFGLPGTGPQGESVALGSVQFPRVALGAEVEWLLPPEAHAIYFLVERPDGPDNEPTWRSGYQRLFGPYTFEELPSELLMD